MNSHRGIPHIRNAFVIVKKGQWAAGVSLSG